MLLTEFFRAKICVVVVVHSMARIAVRSCCDDGIETGPPAAAADPQRAIVDRTAFHDSRGIAYFNPLADANDDFAAADDVEIMPRATGPSKDAKTLEVIGLDIDDNAPVVGNVIPQVWCRDVPSLEVVPRSTGPIFPYLII